MDLKMNKGTKEIKTRQRKTENSLVTLMNVVQTRLTVTSELATQQTIMPQLPNSAPGKILPQRKQINHGQGLNVGMAEHSEKLRWVIWWVIWSLYFHPRWFMASNCPKHGLLAMVPITIINISKSVDVHLVSHCGLERTG